MPGTSKTGFFLAAFLFSGAAAGAPLPGQAAEQAGPGGGKARSEQARPSREGLPDRRLAREAVRPGEPRMRREAMPPRWMERLREMTPEQQERFMTNNERFRMLPAERQAEIRENLRRWNSLSPEQQRAFRERDEVWRSMSPEQRRRVREEIMPRWQQLEPRRRQALMRRLRVLRDLSEEERGSRLADEAFLTGLSTDDRELLRELSRLHIGPPPERHEPPPEEPPT